ncbi:MAG TPA: hypothetical protein VGI81_20545 [Tepidisphaeraceae bacterium]
MSLRCQAPLGLGGFFGVDDEVYGGTVPEPTTAALGCFLPLPVRAAETAAEPESLLATPSSVGGAVRYWKFATNDGWLVLPAGMWAGSHVGGVDA